MLDTKTNHVLSMAFEKRRQSGQICAMFRNLISNGR